MTTAAREFRDHVADLLLRTGPDAPTLCKGWSTRDLAAHLVVRDRRPDALPGILLPPLSGVTSRIQDVRAARPFPETVDLVRSGPPRWNLVSLPAIDARANLVEYAIHSEDIRGAQSAETRSDLPAAPSEAQNAVWEALPMIARIRLRTSPVSVRATRPDGTGRDLFTPKSASGPGVELAGEPSAILTAISGRGAAASGVEICGEESAVTTARRLLG